MYTAKEVNDLLSGVPMLINDHPWTVDAIPMLQAYASLLAAVEGSGEEIVRELLDPKGFACEDDEVMAKAAARIVSDAQEKERLRAELASVNASLATERANGEREHGSRDQQITQLEVEIASVEGHADRLHYVLSWPPRRACND